MGCSRLGTGEDKAAVQKEIAVSEARCVAPDCTGSEVRAAYDRGGMPAVRALQAEKEAQLRAASFQAWNWGSPTPSVNSWGSSPASATNNTWSASPPVAPPSSSWSTPVLSVSPPASSPAPWPAGAGYSGGGSSGWSPPPATVPPPAIVTPSPPVITQQPTARSSVTQEGGRGEVSQTPSASPQTGTGPTSFQPANSDDYGGITHSRTSHQSAKHGTVVRETSTAIYEGLTTNPRKAAAAEDRRNLQEFRKEHELKGTTDEAGHKLRLSWGIPLGSTPEAVASDRDNLSRQSAAVNRGANREVDGKDAWFVSEYFKAEDKIMAWLESHPDQRLRVSVTTVSFPDKRGDREAYRLIQVALPDGTCPAELLDLTLTPFANPVWKKR